MDFLKQIITPSTFAIIFISCFFLFLTRKSLYEMVNKLSVKFNNKNISIKTGEQKNVSANGNFTQSKKIKELYVNLNKSDEKIKQLEENNDTLFKLWKSYMFSYFNLYLVPNSKLALLWLHNNANSTKEMFQLNMTISPEANDVQLEKEAIFNALAANSLINKGNNDLYTVTNIGKDFLIFIGLIT